MITGLICWIHWRLQTFPSSRQGSGREYPVTWQEGMEPYYPVNDEKNQALYQKYAKLAEKEENVIFGGRLGEYKYYDMDKVIASAMVRAKEIFGA